MFGRRIIVTAAGLLITEGRIRVTVERDNDRTSDSATVELWNLDRATERVIDSRSERVSVQAGYDDTGVGLLFEGQTQEVHRERRTNGGVSRVTTIECGDLTRSVAAVGTVAALGGVSARSYAGPERLDRIVADFAADIGLPVEGLDTLPSGATVTDWTYSGQATDGLGALLASVGCGFYEDDGVLRVRRRGSSTRRGAPGFVVSEATGMIGSPTPTDEGCEVTMFLQPAIQRGSLLRVVSESVNGDFGTVAFRHSADNWEGRFSTWAEARA